MSSLTTYYGLIKPNPDPAPTGDFVNVADLNANMDTIDGALNDHDVHLAQIDNTLGNIQSGTPPFVSVYCSTTPAIPNGVTTAVVFDVEIEDVLGFHAPGTDHLTVPIGLGGLYLLKGNVSYAIHSNGARAAYIEVAGNLVDYAAQAITSPSRTSEVTVTTIQRLTETQQIRLMTYQDSGGALNLIATGPAQMANNLQMVRLGS